MDNKELSISQLVIIKAYDRGFRISSCGQFIQTPHNKLTQKSFKHGYPIFRMRYSSKVFSIGWHRLQAYQKYGLDMFKIGIEVRHNNSIRIDCSYNNILIGTHNDNMGDRSEETVLKIKMAMADGKRKYNATEVRAFYNTNKSYKETMEEFGISSKGTLHFILNNAKYS